MAKRRDKPKSVNIFSCRSYQIVVDPDYVIPLHRVGKHDLSIAGGKGANLGEMMKMGITVPEGFIVTTLSFDRFIQLYRLGNVIREIVESTDVEDIAKLFKSSQKIRETILSYEIPPVVKLKIINAYREFLEKDGTKLGPNAETGPILVAVRSSATTEDLPNASFAGQHASFLNVKGEEALIESLRKCWASLFEPRAIFYRMKHGFSEASIAVIVQKMVNSDKSGTMFTIDPITGQNLIMIEAIWGLGESIVSGEASPDLYKVSKIEFREKRSPNIDIQISKKLKMRTHDYSLNKTVTLDVPHDKINSQVLTNEELLELASYGILLEDKYGRPQDIEFAIENGKIEILQTRAITSSVKRQVEKFLESKGKQLLKGIGASPGAASGRVRIITNNNDLTRIEEGDIIVTTMTSPDLVPSMSKSAAIITDLGGRTCHAAIVSREMGIPAIVGTEEATRVLKEGQQITVDAYNGIVYEGKIDSSIATAEHEQEKEQERGQATSPSSPSPSNTRVTKTRTQVKVNLAFPQRLEEIEPRVDGVGLLRIEHMVAQSSIHPARLIKDGRKEDYVKILMDGIRPIAKSFAPKPIWIRTLDARSDEFRNLKGGEDEPREPNPMLGWHGIRRSLDDPELLKAELEAIKRLNEQEGFDNLKIMLPFVISVDEVNRAREIARQVGLSDKLKIGIMVETPASVMIIDKLCKEAKISFASFGTNDLIQLTLGIDRNNEKLSNMASALHPAILRSMKAVINTCNQEGVETSICGESGSSPEIAKILVRYGIKSVSCNIDAIDTIRKTIYEEEQKQEFRDTK